MYMKVPRSKLLMTAVTAVLVAGMGLIMIPVHADVSPVLTDDTLAPGDSVEYLKTVDVPEFPPKIDVCLLVDLSGSYWDDLPNIKAQMPGVYDAVVADIPNARFCLATFVDFPFTFWGGETSGDYAYALEQDLTPNKSDWTDAVNAMTTKNGWDGPESQYEAVYQMATGAGTDVPPAGASFGDVPAGGDPSWRDDATKVLIITTDASFHTAGDSDCTGRDSGSASDCPFGYPGPTAADATDALVDAGIKVIALKAPGSTGQMDALAAATGGSVETTSSTSDDIADAILAAFEALTFDVTGTPAADCLLDISLDPTAHLDVEGGDTVYFDETILVPADITGVENPECCDVVFTASDAEIGTQTVCVTAQIDVDIDIKPWSFPNSINMKRTTGVIPVAILGSDTFDVTTVDVTTLTFGVGAQVPDHDLTDGIIYADRLEDVNDDGFTDLVSHYVIDGTGIVSGDTEACISGENFDGVAIYGCDSILTRH
jgi:hypothetical protein